MTREMKEYLNSLYGYNVLYGDIRTHRKHYIPYNPVYAPRINIGVINILADMLTNPHLHDKALRGINTLLSEMEVQP